MRMLAILQLIGNLGQAAKGTVDTWRDIESAQWTRKLRAREETNWPMEDEMTKMPSIEIS